MPVGIPHVDIYNDTDDDLVMELEIVPNSPFIETFARTLGHYLAADELDDQEVFKPLQLISVLRATRAKSYATGLPIPLQKALMPALATVARARGVKVVAAGR